MHVYNNCYLYIQYRLDQRTIYTCRSDFEQTFLLSLPTTAEDVITRGLSGGCIGKGKGG